MAVPHFSVSIVARGSGRSAVLSAAYRHCAKMDYEREARTIDYTRKQGLLHEEFVIPADAPEWLQSMVADRSVSGASEAFWNKVEEFEKRSDAQLAKDVTIALPIELSAEQNIELVRDFVARHITAQGMIADWVYHDAPGNPHIHLMTTLRPLTVDGFGPKKVAVTGPDGKALRNDSGKIVYELWAGDLENFNAFRDGWFVCQNRHLALAGLDIRVDGRSFEKQGIDLTPTIHLGVGTKAIERKAEGVEEKVALERLELQEERRAENARRIQRNPEIVLDLITREKSVFDERDVAKILHRYIDDAGLFQSLMARILQSPETLRLDREQVDFATGARTSAKYTTRELIRLEAEMANRAIWLSHRSSHSVSKAVLESTVARHDRLSDEQKTAIEHVAGDAGITAVIGRAGAGKTTMMKAAREVWEAAGYRVVGAALAGKAAEGLEKEAGIVSRTLSSWELRWEKERDHLDEKTIFVIDEAGMVSSRQLALFVEAVTKAGAKLVLIGDPDQLQPIEAGAAFRAIADRVGYAELETIYRQKDQWMRDASLDLARGNVALALNAYEQAGLVQTGWTRQDAIAGLIESWNREFDPDKTTLILAHRRRDVRELNELARARLVERGIVGEGFAFSTEAGPRRFAAGDQIVFLKNEGSLGVKNGMLAKVVDAAPGRIVAEIGDGESRTNVIVEQRFYANVDHGYATTIHKSQGATVDRVKVLASSTLDRHLTYVAMTRHREAAELHVGMEEFTNRRGGILVEHGVAPYEHKPGNRDSYFVTLEDSDGQQRTIWGVDLKRALEEARPDIGDRIGLKHDGSETVTLPDGTTAERNTWKVIDVTDLAIERLKERLARDGSKETTLDYEGASSYRAALRFAEARGLHLMNVARTISKDRLVWTVRQKQRLIDLAAKLATLGARLGLISGSSNIFIPNTAKEEKPMVSGITTFPKTIDQAVEDRVAADPALKKQWEEVSMRFHHVFANPEAAFKAVNVDAMLHDQAAAAKTISRITAEPEAFGGLKGKTGLLASRSDKADRDRALKNAAPLADSIADYLRQRGEAERRSHAQELAVRRQVALEVPALSANAKSVLERVRDAIDRNDLPSGLEYALADKMVKAELEGFAKAVTERFGERTLLPLAAKDNDGEAFQRVTVGMNAAQKSEVQQAWNTMRTVQQLSAHERSVTALKQAEALCQTKSQGLTLK
ncbi:Ti-type conjugative transfer relaxase TraA [Agrobacterium tumefaciens]|uniref:Ti-type conjugative transfer relaxase TraA n=1 Tax=Agrobacterium tumefaciens TaxID=358 RepID=A0AA44FA68_AGRTU|nr:Ti-type conjugative transfer relaxase TraA [Agrobacterium tumefaciens]NTB87959.1 Ti-type conjugative transfer relaxase TraA [Agrobacterium tumefaciens]NTC20035.1 Ti-type conjugative transfer relaxase TraA [Agrobacterium tumefaciens]NTC31206.1 Ti-type conjugative transfer relaxase TraA [Agrobacterium tumefaciens]NTE57917.1 Ti-type conjugative transfer relaxase TraA [Agrobacterium tumefaciens]NTE74615.1 Ti-type conjugative transfer relaxase TraA [Agrobacterium tumefaciens]